jgi:uncharacterized phage protein (predicted DNA packaging)
MPIPISPAPPEAVADAKAYLRIDGSDEDALLATLTEAAIDVCEHFAGLSVDWSTSPAPLRQGIVRLVAYFYAHRDAADDAGPPAAVAALWRPYRRMRLA